jgi:hypothetical protein
MEEAFRKLRAIARANNQSLHDTATNVINRTLSL